eukprot:8024416-Pyramimonas_sp.AAC.1
MADYTPASYKGDPVIPHADESNFKAWIGGCWGFVALNYASDFFEPKPSFTPDYILATAEEAHRKKCIKKGKPYKSILQAREEKASDDWKFQTRKWKIERL